MIHKTKKEESKKHISMRLRWEFRLFWLDFGIFRPFRSPADMTQYGLIMAESAWFGANPKKKIAQTRHRCAGNRDGRRVPR